MLRPAQRGDGNLSVSPLANPCPLPTAERRLASTAHSSEKCHRSGSDGPSYWQSRFSVTLKPPVVILLPGAHSHVVLDHGRRVVPGRPRLLVFFNGHLGLFDLPCLREGRGQDQLRKGGKSIHIVYPDHLLVVAKCIVAVFENVETVVVGGVRLDALRFLKPLQSFLRLPAGIQ